MSWIYQKKIVDGEKSSRKLFGIPLYMREDNKYGVTRRYICGLWKTYTTEYEKQIFAVNLKICTKKIASNLDAKVSCLYRILENTFIDTCNFKTIIQSQDLHKKTFSKYKNIFNNQEVVLIGLGNTAKLHEKIEDAIYVGVDETYLLKNVSLDYLFCQKVKIDDVNYLVDYKKNKCIKFFARINDESVRSECTRDKVRIPRYIIDKCNAEEYYIYGNGKKDIAYDIQNEPLHSGGTVFNALQFVLHGHPKRVYLVGCEYAEMVADVNKNILENEQIKIWEQFKVYIKELYPDIEIVSEETKE